MTGFIWAETTRRVKVSLLAIPEGEGEDFSAFCGWLGAFPKGGEGRAHWPRASGDLGRATHIVLWDGDPVALWYPEDTEEADRRERVEERHAARDLRRRDEVEDLRQDLRDARGN